jgi:hypothetical protein
MEVIIGSTTDNANIVATAASMAFPPSTSISVPANDASGWFEVTIPRLAVASCLNVGRDELEVFLRVAIEPELVIFSSYQSGTVMQPSARQRRTVLALIMIDRTLTR